MFHSLGRITRAARGGISSSRLGSGRMDAVPRGGLQPVACPLCAGTKSAFSVKAFDGWYYITEKCACQQGKAGKNIQETLPPRKRGPPPLSGEVFSAQRLPLEGKTLPCGERCRQSRQREGWKLSSEARLMRWKRTPHPALRATFPSRGRLSPAGRDVGKADKERGGRPSHICSAMAARV